jgi:FtsP/CotA-like multicopper oxidase with cupredoxin domain
LPVPAFHFHFSRLASQDRTRADYTLHIKSSPIEIAPKRIVSAITYNGQFPGPLLRFKEGRQVTVDIHNDTDTAEQLHWHGQRISTDVDGAAEEGTPFIPAHDKRRIAFTPNPAGFRFYHTHNRAGANLAAGQYGGEVGPVYIEPTREPGGYDREVFLVLKEFEPTVQSRRRHAPRLLVSGGAESGTQKNRRSVNESVSRQRYPSRLRSRLSVFHYQRTHARPWSRSA